jgi:hypothetical protein
VARLASRLATAGTGRAALGIERRHRATYQSRVEIIGSIESAQCREQSPEEQRRSTEMLRRYRAVSGSRGLIIFNNPLSIVNQRLQYGASAMRIMKLWLKCLGPSADRHRGISLWRGGRPLARIVGQLARYCARRPAVLSLNEGQREIVMSKLKSCIRLYRQDVEINRQSGTRAEMACLRAAYCFLPGKKSAAR